MVMCTKQLDSGTSLAKQLRNMNIRDLALAWLTLDNEPQPPISAKTVVSYFCFNPRLAGVMFEQVFDLRLGMFRLVDCPLRGARNLELN